MSNTPTTTTSRAERLSAFLGRNRTLLLALAIVLVGGIVVSVVLAQVLDQRAEAATMAAESLQDDWDAFSSARPTFAAEDGSPAALTEEEQELADSIREQAERILADWPRSYGAQRAHFVLGNLAWELQDYEGAATHYTTLAEEFSRSYLAPIALMNAAAAYENLGESDTAAGLYGRVADSTAATTEVARAIFNLGRLAEAEGDTERALEHYRRLVDEHASSNWTNLGRNRIIGLTSQGAGS